MPKEVEKMKVTGPYDIELRIVSNPCYLCVVRKAVTVAMERFSIDENTCAQVMMAVDEALTNVIRHGYKGSNDKPIWVKIGRVESKGRKGFVIVVEDRGIQVSLDRIKGRDLEDVKPGGLGVHIIKKVMDNVEYSFREDGGMRLVMSKYEAPVVAG